MRLALSGAFVVAGREGPIACRTAFALYAAQCRAMSPETAAEISGVDADAIREAARVLWQDRPVAHYTWTGLEQQSNATQTDRAIAILHALTGSIDAAGGNLQLAQVPVNDVSGNDLRETTQWCKALGLAERPLRLGKSGWILSDDLYRAAIEAQPYRVRALVGFGANLLLSSPHLLPLCIRQYRCDVAQPRKHRRSLGGLLDCPISRHKLPATVVHSLSVSNSLGDALNVARQSG